MSFQVAQVSATYTNGDCRAMCRGPETSMEMVFADFVVWRPSSQASFLTLSSQNFTYLYEDDLGLFSSYEIAYSTALNQDAAVARGKALGKALMPRNISGAVHVK